MFTSIDKAIATFLSSAIFMAVAPIGINPATSFEDAINMIISAGILAFVTWVVPNKKT